MNVPTLLSQDELKTLMQCEDTCVSIYLPVHKAGPPIRQDPIRFKNLISEAIERLEQRGLRRTDAEEFLAPAKDLDKPEFWRNQNEGLAIFVAPNLFRYYRLPLYFEELVSVGDRFHLKPLIPLFTHNGRFYILALSQHQIKLFQASRYQLNEVDIGDTPTSLEEALQYDQPEEQVQMHTGNPNPAAGKSLIFHGHGVGTTDDKTAIWRFFQKVDAGIRKVLDGENAPLIMAGVEYLLPIYRDANSYPHLIEGCVTVNSEALTPKELHDKAWNVMFHYFNVDREKAANRYRELAGNDGQASRDLEEVIKAAYYQRVDSLFVATGEKQWGQFDPESNSIELHREPDPRDVDLLDFAAIQTFLNGGTVYAEKPENLPDRALLAATFRY